jgi:hypothetical protein
MNEEKYKTLIDQLMECTKKLDDMVRERKHEYALSQHREEQQQRWEGTVLAEIEKVYSAIGVPEYDDGEMCDPDARDPTVVGDSVKRFVTNLQKELQVCRDDAIARHASDGARIDYLLGKILKLEAAMMVAP